MASEPDAVPSAMVNSSCALCLRWAAVAVSGSDKRSVAHLPVKRLWAKPAVTGRQRMKASANFLRISIPADCIENSGTRETGHKAKVGPDKARAYKAPSGLNTGVPVAFNNSNCQRDH